MGGWHGWVALIGGILAVASQWVGTDANSHYWLPVLGGALAIIAGIGAMMK